MSQQSATTHAGAAVGDPASAPASGRPAPPTPRVPAVAGLDGLRALAATAIVVHHAGFASGDTFQTALGPVLGRLDVGVPVFFVISGFLLYRPFVASQFDGAAPPPTAPFMRRRILRIYPAYWLAFLTLLAVGSIQVTGIGDFLLGLTLLHVVTQRTALTGLTQAWSLSVEMAFYVLLPGWAALTGRVVRPASTNVTALRLLAGAAALAGASVAFRLGMWLLDPSWWELQYVWLPTVLDMFAAGMALAVLDLWARRRALPARLAGAIADRAVALWVGAVVLVWFVSTQLGLPVGLDRGSQVLEAARQTCYVGIGALTVAPIALSAHATRRSTLAGLPLRLLCWRPLAAVGVVSYGLYLWHQAGIDVAQRLAGWDEFEGSWHVLTAGALVVTLPIAWASYVFLEQPVSRRFGGRARASGTAGAT